MIGYGPFISINVIADQGGSGAGWQPGHIL